MNKKWLNRRRGVLAALGNGAPPEALRCVPFPDAARTPRLLGEGLAPRLLGAVSRPLVMAMVVGAMALTAQADTQTWSGTANFTANATILDPVELDGEVEVSVASGKTVIISNEVSDVSGKTGKIKLVGGGTLTLANANTFTGGAYIDTGVLQVTTGGSLGTGDITIKGGTAAVSQLQFGQLNVGIAGNQTITFSNNITVENGGDTDHYQLMFGPHNNADGYRKHLKLAGDVKCTGDLYISLNNTYHLGSICMYFDGTVESTDDVYFNNLSLLVYFRNVVKIRDFRNASATGARPITFQSSNNSIRRISLDRSGVTATCADAFGGAALDYAYKGGNPAAFTLGGFTHNVAYLAASKFESKPGYRPYLNGSSNSTGSRLVITGGVERAVFDGLLGSDTTAKYSDISVDIDADDSFTQVVTNGSGQATYAANTMNGTLTVNRGHLEIGGVVTFTNLTGMVVNSGSLSFDTADTGDIPALKSLAAITVKNGAKLTLKGANLFGTVAKTLNLETGALIDIPATTFEVSSLTVDGRTWAAGQYTSSMLPMLPAGVTLNVTAGTWGTTSIAVNWTGAGSDNATTTAANWENSTHPVNTGAAKVSLTGGEGMDFADGDWFYQIVNNIEPNKDNPVRPFVIKPASEGATLHLGHGITSTEMTQLILSGHISDLPEQSSASDNRIYCKLSTNLVGAVGVIQPTAYTKKLVMPLVLTNATIDMALRVALDCKGQITPFVASPHTTNEVRGLTYIAGYTLELYAETNSVTRFLGGYQSGNTSIFRGSGKFVVDKSISTGSGAAVQVLDGCTLSLSTTNGCSVGGTKYTSEGIKIETGTLSLLADNALNPELQIWSASASYKSVIEMNTTTQTIGALYFSANAGNTAAYLHGEYPAKLTLTGKHRSAAYKVSVKKPYCSSRIDGWLSLCYTGEGTNEVFTLANRAFESYGDLEVSGKKLLLGSGATWLNGTNFTARGTGTLAFTAANQVNSEIAALHLADTGKVEIPSGVTLKVASAETNGVELAIGSYTSAKLGDFISGGGTLKVGKKGTTIILW